MYEIMVHVYGWDHTEETFFSGRCSSKFAEEMLAKYSRMEKWDPNTEYDLSWDSRGGKSHITIRKVK